MKISNLISLLILLLLPGKVSASDYPPGDKKEGISSRTVRLDNGAEVEFPYYGLGDVWQDTTVEYVQVKRPGISFLSSAVLPGAGQLYNGSKKRAVGFFVVEAALWYGWYSYHSKAEDNREEYKQYADEYWNILRWALGEGIDICGNPTDQGGTHRIDVYPDCSPIKSDEYYENIGKYDQFALGWEGATSSNNKGGNLTEERSAYLEMRAKVNDDFRFANTLASTVMFNHILSVFDAVYTAKKLNDRAIRASIRAVPMKYAGRPIQGFTLALSW